MFSGSPLQAVRHKAYVLNMNDKLTLNLNRNLGSVILDKLDNLYYEIVIFLSNVIPCLKIIYYLLSEFGVKLSRPELFSFGCCVPWKQNTFCIYMLMQESNKLLRLKNIHVKRVIRPHWASNTDLRNWLKMVYFTSEYLCSLWIAIILDLRCVLVITRTMRFLQ